MAAEDPDQPGEGEAGEERVIGRPLWLRRRAGNGPRARERVLLRGLRRTGEAAGLTGGGLAADAGQDVPAAQSGPQRRGRPGNPVPGVGQARRDQVQPVEERPIWAGEWLYSAPAWYSRVSRPPVCSSPDPAEIKI